MTDNKSDKKRILSILIGVMTLLLCMAAAFSVCTEKCGLHEDEYYSYYSSNRTDGLWLDGEVPSSDILKEVTVLPGEGFDFALVKEVQSWDVHPPIYYFLLHFVCSCMPGVFSKWQGLAINLVCLFICLLLMKKLGDMLLPDHDLAVTLVCGAWGISSATLTAAAFIRMYMLLTLWIFLVTLLHVKEYTDCPDRSRWDFYVKLGVITFLGFMTHYYFFIWLFFLAVFFNLGRLIKTRRIREILIYGGTMVITFGLCYVFYPAWPAQMFKGQRGAQATGNFLDISNTWERICFFAEKVNRIGFGGLLVVWLLILAGMGIWIVLKKKQSSENAGKTGLPLQAVLLAACLCYFLTVSKTGLMYEDSSIRYQMPMLGVLYLTLLMITADAVKRLFAGGRTAELILMVTGAVLLAGGVVSDLNGNISFLYPEEKDHIQIISEYPDAQMLYIYDSGESWCVWDSANEMLEHETVVFAPGDDYEQMDGTPVEEAGQILLYVDTREDIDPVLHHITCINSNISTFEYLFSNKYCDVYIGR